MCKNPHTTHDTGALRRTLGQYPTGVAVVTAIGESGNPVGMTINSVSSISLTPPLVGWCIDHAAGSYAAFADAEGFSLSILASGQDDVARRFATRGADKFRGLPSNAGDASDDAPIIPGACAWLHCSVYCRVTLGDHLMLVGHVRRHRASARKPLVFAGGQFQRLTHTPDERASCQCTPDQFHKTIALAKR
jgi:flavin reductase (DIM6/NTAB) family NADH-FMN oxidoreductase RutF